VYTQVWGSIRQRDVTYPETGWVKFTLPVGKDEGRCAG
jgi:hypothetical protein